MNKDEIFWNVVFAIVYISLVVLSGLLLYSLHRLPTQIGLFDFVILALAVFRLIRLFVYDWVTQYIRDYLGTFEKGPGHTLSDLLSCPWCTGVWMALFASFFYFLTPLAWYPLFLLALAGLATYLQFIIIRINEE